MGLIGLCLFLVFWSFLLSWNFDRERRRLDWLIREIIQDHRPVLDCTPGGPRAFIDWRMKEGRKR